MIKRVLVVTVVAAVPIAATSFSSARVPQSSEPRLLGTIVARTHDTLASIAWTRPLSDGRVFVIDQATRRILLYDSSLSHSIVVADTTGATSHAYGNGQSGQGTLIPYRGDSTFFLDGAAQALLLIDPQGKIIKSISLPMAGQTAINAYGRPGIDARGRLIFRIPPARSPTVAPGPLYADSAPIIRASLFTHAVDTAAFTTIRAPFMVAMAEGGFAPRLTPFNQNDDWAVLSDGSVAVVRGVDFHVEVVDPNGKRTIGPKITFPWARLSDADKERLVDSLHQRDSTIQAQTRAVAARSAPSAAVLKPGPPTPVIAAESIPDYRAALIAPGARADNDGNIWVKVTQPGVVPTASVYYIINRSGELVDRVQLPGGCILGGFGPGVVYYTSAVGSGSQLARARLH